MKNIFTVSGAYIAALIGAGFASGQEIISFFVRHGKTSIFGIILSAVIFGVFAAAVLEECSKKGISSYSEYLGGFMGKRTKAAAELMTLVFALSVFCVMAACCGEMGCVLFGIKNKYGALIMCVLCGVVMAFKSDSALNINAVIGGLITVSIITCCLYLLRYREHQAFSNNAKMLMSGVSYSGYNLLTAGVLLAQMSGRLKKRSDAYLTGFTSSFSLLVIMTLMWGLLSIYHGKIQLGEIPMLTLAMRENNGVAAAYSVILFLAVFSTALSNGIGAVNIMAERLGRKSAAAISASVGFLLSGAGFSALINGLYRVCGYIGAVFALYIILRYIMIKISAKTLIKRGK